MFDANQASFVCDFIECLTCSNGAPFKLMDWQRDAVTEFYGEMVKDECDPDGLYIRRYQYLYIEIAKKNGKSELAAGLAVYHLYADGEINGEVYVVAADRDNAGIVFNAAKWMVEHSPTLMKRSRIVDSTKTIYDTVSGSKMKVLSSEAYSKHGYKPSC
nr:terminase large subunit [uncultured Agathobaculum sp.]